jgi:hypothetical protein
MRGKAQKVTPEESMSYVKSLFENIWFAGSELIIIGQV